MSTASVESNDSSRFTDLQFYDCKLQMSLDLSLSSRSRLLVVPSHAARRDLSSHVSVGDKKILSNGYVVDDLGWPLTS